MCMCVPACARARFCQKVETSLCDNRKGHIDDLFPFINPSLCYRTQERTSSNYPSFPPAKIRHFLQPLSPSQSSKMIKRTFPHFLTSLLHLSSQISKRISPTSLFPPQDHHSLLPPSLLKLPPSLLKLPPCLLAQLQLSHSLLISPPCLLAQPQLSHSLLISPPCLLTQPQVSHSLLISPPCLLTQPHLSPSHSSQMEKGICSPTKPEIRLIDSHPSWRRLAKRLRRF